MSSSTQCRVSFRRSDEQILPVQHTIPSCFGYPGATRFAQDHLQPIAKAASVFCQARDDFRNHLAVRIVPPSEAISQRLVGPVREISYETEVISSSITGTTSMAITAEIRADKADRLFGLPPLSPIYRILASNFYDWTETPILPMVSLSACLRH